VLGHPTGRSRIHAAAEEARRYRLVVAANLGPIRIALPPVSSASEMRKSGMCMTAVLWTFRFRAPFAMRFWRKGSLKSINQWKLSVE
jgi:hypothetical protein